MRDREREWEGRRGEKAGDRGGEEIERAGESEKVKREIKHISKHSILKTEKNIFS